MQSNTGLHLKNSADRHARQAADHPALTWAARIGFVVTGLLHIMIGWIALKVATGSGGGEASNSGAMAQIASTPGGQALLWIMTVGLVGLGLWHLCGLFVSEETKDKAKNVILGIVYLSLSISTFKFASGGSSSDGQKATSVTAKVMQMPGGVILLAIAGLIIIGVGAYNVYAGVTKRFEEKLRAGSTGGKVGSAIILSGMAGYIARGLAFAVLGIMVIWAGFSTDPQKASGLDSALRTIGQQPFGAVLLIVVALGFVLYGVFSIARAKYTSEA